MNRRAEEMYDRKSDDLSMNMLHDILLRNLDLLIGFFSFRVIFEMCFFVFAVLLFSVLDLKSLSNGTVKIDGWIFIDKMNSFLFVRLGLVVLRISLVK